MDFRRQAEMEKLRAEVRPADLLQPPHATGWIGGWWIVVGGVMIWLAPWSSHTVFLGGCIRIGRGPAQAF